MILGITEELTLLRDAIEALIEYRKKQGNAIVDLQLRADIETRMTAFTLLFQKVPELKKTFEFLRDGYLNLLIEDSEKEKQNG